MPHPDDYDPDRRDDPYADRPRGDGYDDRGPGGPPGAYDDHDRPRRSRRDYAADRLKLPAIFLIILGLLSVFAAVTTISLVWISPDVMMEEQYKWWKELFPNQPLPPYEEWVKDQQRTVTIFNGVRVLLAILMTIGAMKMKEVEGYGLAMTSAIIAIIPLCPNECCCATPFGIWAVIVLLNEDVKRAFALPAARPESY